MNPLSWLETHRGRYSVVRWLFPRLLAAIYLIAFVSWGVQYDGLVGENGILPAKNLIENIHAFEEREHKTLFWQFPSVFHWHYSDAFAHGCLIACGVLCVLVMAGVAQGPLLALLWFGYLSFATTGDIFMGYQWDALLLEAGFLALFVVPWRLWSFRGVTEPPRGSIFLLHWLLFRLMFLSGYVKIGGGDLPWENMTALLYHYETQPLPNGFSWLAHHWPRGSTSRAAGSCMASNSGCRLRFSLAAGAVWRRAGLPRPHGDDLSHRELQFLHLSHRRARTHVARRPLVAEVREPLAAHRRRGPAPAPAALDAMARARRRAARVLFTLLAADSFLAGRIRGFKPVLPTAWHEKLDAPIHRTRSFNAYGLFQDMTEERPEIVLEVSDDGTLPAARLQIQTRRSQHRRPPFIAPHQPRLDWQMWFAALYPGYDPHATRNPTPPCTGSASSRTALLQHKQPVWDLLEPPPFPVEKITHIPRPALSLPLHPARGECPASGAPFLGNFHVAEWWERQLIGNFSRQALIFHSSGLVLPPLDSPHIRHSPLAPFSNSGTIAAPRSSTGRRESPNGA
jgi:hypothetical protein